MFGVCLGLEEILYTLLQKEQIQKLEHFNHLNSNGKLDQLNQHAPMFKSISPLLLNYVLKKKVLRFNHHFGISVGMFQKSKVVSKYMAITSTAKDNQGNKFVSSYEARSYPIMAVQFHPEKNEFNFRSNNVSRNPLVIMFNSRLIKNFVNMCKKSYQRFPSRLEEKQSLINNYQYDKTKNTYMGCYFLDNKNEVTLEEKEINST